MGDQEFKYDVFLSHASEDTEWCLRLAERLKQAGVRVWFDNWELRPGDNLLARVSDGLEQSRKMVAVWTENYFREDKVWTLAESYAQQHKDILSRDRLLIPLLREDCKPKPLFGSLLHIDFRKDSDLDLSVRKLIEALDLPRRDFIERDEEFEMALHEHDPRRLGADRPRGKIFEEEIARLYRLLGYEVEGVEIGGAKIGLQVQKRQGGRMLRDIVACVHPFVTDREREQMLQHQFLARKKFSAHGLIAVAQSFDAKVRADLTESGFDCATHADLLSELLPLGDYTNSLIAEYEHEVDDRWNGADWFIRPNIETDADARIMPALKFFSGWRGDSRRNLVVLLGDLGMGKSTLSKFLAYNLARSYNEDPVRHPAPVLIPLTKLYKEASLNSIVTGHFGERGMNNINFNAFQHLAREGRLVVIFDAFDEMADRMVWRETLGNFLTLVRAAESEAKVLITCRTHYFKDRDDQSEVIGEAARTLEEITRKFRSEKPLFKAARENKAEVIYLREFDDDQIRDYLSKARRGTASEDWVKIEQTYDLGNLAQRPLLLNMIIESLDRFDAGEKIDAAKLYDRYTDDWISREYSKGRVRLRRREKLAMMMELARMMWDEDKSAVRYRELLPFVERLVGEGRIELKDQEVEEIAGEIHNASFLKRNESGEFSFMHRSLMEFFLARSLIEKFVVPHSGGMAEKFVVPHSGGMAEKFGVPPSGGKALESEAIPPEGGTPNEIIEALDTRRFDQKMIFFFEKLDAADNSRGPLRQILTGAYRPRVSENALQLLYWTARHRAGMEKEITDTDVLRRALNDCIPPGVRLAGANLQEITLECIELTNADLSGADLSKATLDHAQFTCIGLYQAKLAMTRLDKISAVETDFRKSDLRGASFVESTIARSDFSGSLNQGQANFLKASLDNVAGLLQAGTIALNRLNPRVQIGHWDYAPILAYNFDGSLIATGGKDGLVLICRSTDLRIIDVFEGHTDSVRALAFSPNSKVLASGGEDGNVCLWDLNEGKLLYKITSLPGVVGGLSFSPDGGKLVINPWADALYLWEVESRKLLRSIESMSPVIFSPRGETLIGGGEDGALKLLDASTGTQIRSIDSDQGNIWNLAIDPSGRILASGRENGTIQIWDIDTGELLQAVRGHRDPVISIALSPGSRTLASSGYDNRTCIWSVATGELLLEIDNHAPDESIAFSPDGNTIAATNLNYSVGLLNAKDGKLYASVDGHDSRIYSIALSQDSQHIAIASNRAFEIRSIYSKSSRLKLLKEDWFEDTFVAFSPNSRTIAGGGDSVILWDVDTGEPIHELEMDGESITSAAFSPDSKIIASGSGDNAVRLWQVEDGKLLRTLKGHRDSVLSVSFSPDGNLIASGSADRTVRLWHSNYGKLLFTFKGHKRSVRSVGFSPDGNLIASGSSDHTVRLWLCADGKLLRSLEGHTSSVRSVSISPDGKLIASGSRDCTVRLWQCSDGKLLHVVEGDLGWIHTVAFAPNGKHLIAAGVKGRLQFIDVETGQTFFYRYDFGPDAWLDLLPEGRFDASPEGLRYLCYTEFDAGGKMTLNSYTAEELAKEFYDPDAVREVLAKYV